MAFVSVLRTIIDPTGAEVGAAKTAAATNAIAVGATNASRALTSVGASASASATGLSAAGAAAGTAATGMRSAAVASESAAVGFGAAAKSLAALIGVFGTISVIRSATQQVAEFERTMANLANVVGVDRASLAFKQLEETAQKLGRTTEFTSREAAEGLLFLARAGYSTKEAIEAIPSTLDLAVAGTLELGEAANIASNVLSQFALATKETGRVADVLVGAANRANTDVRGLAEAMTYAGPIAGALGISLEEVAAAAGTLGNAGIFASQAGTNLRQVMIQLLNPTEEAKKTIAELGLTLADLSPSSHSLIEIFDRLRSVELSAAEAAQIFQARNAGAAIVLTKNVETLKDLRRALSDVTGEAHTASRAVNDTLAGSFKNLGSAVSGLSQEVFGGTFKEGLKTSVDGWTLLANRITDASKAADQSKDSFIGISDILFPFPKLLARAGEAQFGDLPSPVAPLSERQTKSIDEAILKAHAYNVEYQSLAPIIRQARRELEEFNREANRPKDTLSSRLGRAGDIAAGVDFQLSSFGRSREEMARARDELEATRTVEEYRLSIERATNIAISEQSPLLDDIKRKTQLIVELNAAQRDSERQRRRDLEEQIALESARAEAERERQRELADLQRKADQERTRSAEAYQNTQERIRDSQQADVDRRAQGFASGTANTAVGALRSATYEGQVDPQQVMRGLAETFIFRPLEELITKQLFENVFRETVPIQAAVVNINAGTIRSPSGFAVGDGSVGGAGGTGGTGGPGGGPVGTGNGAVNYGSIFGHPLGAEGGPGTGFGGGNLSGLGAGIAGIGGLASIYGGYQASQNKNSTAGKAAGIAQAVGGALTVAGIFFPPLLPFGIGLSLAGAGGGAFFNANGNAYDVGGHRVYPHANGDAFGPGGSIISSLSYFRSAEGMNSIAEREPEGVLPLTRGRNGRLGVEAVGGGGTTNINLRVVTPNADSFRMSRRHIADDMRKAERRRSRGRY